MPNVRYEAVLEALQRHRAGFVSDAPGGADTEDIDRAILSLDVGTDVLVDECRELTEEIATGNRSETLRTSLQQKEAMLREGVAELRRLREQRKLLESKHLRARLDELQEAFIADPIDVARANAALRASVESVVVDPHKGALALHWRHSDQPTSLSFNSGKHDKEFGYVEGDYVFDE